MAKAELAESEPQLFLRIFNHYNKKILNFIYRMSQDYHLAEDLTQEVFLRVYQRKPNLNEHQNFQGWIFRVARNLCLNALRNERTRISHENELRNQTGGVCVETNNPDYDLTARETRQVVKEVIAELNNNQREVLILKEYHNFSYQEIAEITHSSVSAVKSLLFRARESLRKKLQTSRR